MSGPARHGVLVYAKDVQKLSAFYTDFFKMKVVRETAEFIALESGGFNLIVHRSPVDIAERNFNTFKIFLTVDSLEDARQRVAEYGGSALEGEWSNPIFTVCNIADPEGNHIQIREFKA